MSVLQLKLNETSRIVWTSFLAKLTYKACTHNLQPIVQQITVTDIIVLVLVKMAYRLSSVAKEDIIRI